MLGVGLSLDKLEMAAEPAAQLRDAADDPVVRQEPPVLLERVRVLQARLRLGRVADVGEEGGGANIERPCDERLAAVRGDRLAVDVGRPVRR